jgi:outer membrane protein assembly factor BamB
LYYGRQGNEDANTLLGLDIKTGSIVWEIPVEGNILSNPIIDSGIIYYLAQDKIAAVEISTKEKLWTASLGPRQHRNVSSQRIAPAVSDGTLYLPRTEPAQVVALDSRTGREKWTFDHFGDYSHPNSGISVAGEVVYFQENDTLFGLNASDGTELWRCPEGRREPGSSPALIGETVYVVNADNFLVAIQ